MERVTGIFRTATHAMGVDFEKIRTSARERRGCGGPTQSRFREMPPPVVVLRSTAMESDGQNSYIASPLAPILYHHPPLQLTSIQAVIS
jgi:hypothetical protein